MGSFREELKHMLHPHYIINLLLAGSFFFLKTTPYVCENVFDNCEFELREMELLTFLGCIVVMKNRKQSSHRQYVSTACMFAKILNITLFFRHNPIMAILYVVACLICIVFLPEPTYKGPEYITYFRDESLQEELENDKRITWVIEFYAAWSPSCVNFANTFSELSAKYSLDNLKFGKIDVTRYPKEAEKYKIDNSSWSKTLPTIIIFQGGKETDRRPLMDAKGKVLAKFIFNEDNVLRDFQMNELYAQCKKNPIKKDKKSKESDKQKSE